MIATTPAHKALQKLIRGDPDNKKCSDCETVNPTWASINIGCFLCLECSGIHRALGVHISKVRSTTLDTWQKPWVQHMSAVGNRKVNAYYESKLPQNFVKPSNIKDKAEFIRYKYEAKKWYGEPNGNTNNTVTVESGNAFGVSRQQSRGKKAAPETAAQRAKRRQDERAAKKNQANAAAEVEQHNNNTNTNATNNSTQQQQQQQRAAPTSTLERFKASAASNNIPAVSPMSNQRKNSSQSTNSSSSGSGRETAADRARRRREQGAAESKQAAAQTQQQQQTTTESAAAAATSVGEDLFTGLSSGGMFDGLSESTPRDRTMSRESLRRSLSKRRPSVELQRLNILKSDPTDMSSNHTMVQAANHIELQQARETVANTLTRR